MAFVGHFVVATRTVANMEVWRSPASVWRAQRCSKNASFKDKHNAQGPLQASAEMVMVTSHRNKAFTPWSPNLRGSGLALLPNSSWSSGTLKFEKQCLEMIKALDLISNGDSASCIYFKCTASLDNCIPGYNVFWWLSLLTLIPSPLLPLPSSPPLRSFCLWPVNWTRAIYIHEHGWEIVNWNQVATGLKTMPPSPSMHQ